MGRRALQGKTALITGAGKRIGRETALAFAAVGANVVIHYRNSSDEAESLCDTVRRLGVQAWPLQADFAQPHDEETLFAQAVEAAGPIDILVNSASIFPLNTLATMQFADLMENMRINAWAPYALGRAFAQQAHDGAIINLLDSRIKGYDWRHVAYMMSKHVLAQLTRMMALEFAPKITVNGVAPGLILPPPGKDHSYIDNMTSTVPLLRHGAPEDIADAIIFLAQSDYITGDVIYVDGGRHLQEYLSGPNPH
ncbi:MAG TPA: SDR family oxidoreductase [Armatimonadota bacterium]|jgi:hypothetical protein